jgi:hypothetical protein
VREIEGDEEELSEVDAELAYVEAKICLLQIHKKKCLQGKANASSKPKPLTHKLNLYLKGNPLQKDQIAHMQALLLKLPPSHLKQAHLKLVGDSEVETKDQLSQELLDFILNGVPVVQPSIQYVLIFHAPLPLNLIYAYAFVVSFKKAKAGATTSVHTTQKYCSTS